MTSANISPNFRVILITEESAAVFLMLHGAQGMQDFSDFLRHQLLLMDIIRDYRITRHGRAILKPYKRREVSEFENIVKTFLSDTGVNEADIKKTGFFDVCRVITT